VNVGQLGKILHLDAGTLTPLLKTLEKAGSPLTEKDAKDLYRLLYKFLDE
jgi:DNA-binding MarR family transcriptional regulator